VRREAITFTVRKQNKTKQTNKQKNNQNQTKQSKTNIRMKNKEFCQGRFYFVQQFKFNV